MADQLSVRDRMVLNKLFDSEASPSTTIDTTSTAVSLAHFSEDTFAVIRRQEQGILRSLSEDQESSAQAACVVHDLSNLIDEYPRYASAYVNRAQAARLLFPAEDVFSADRANESARILGDLTCAIQLATPSDASSDVSTHQRKVLAAAHTHRGFLLLKVADNIKKGQFVDFVHGLKNLKLTTPADIEEMASEDFARAGRHGDALGKQMAVKTNPYAKMCGAIVKEALQKEVADATGQQDNGRVDMFSH